MKTYIITFLFWCLFLCSYSVGLQTSIDAAIEADLKSGHLFKINHLEDSLLHSKANIYRDYWLAYIQLQKSFYYLQNQPDSARMVLNQGIKILTDKEKLNTEDYSLLAYLQSMSIRFVAGMEAGILSQKAGNNARNAVQADAQNLRGWFVSGLLDYYTPKQFGGRKHCEEYWQKALSLPVQQIPNPYLPSWGREDTYLMLISYYKETGNRERLSAICEQAHREFPENELFDSHVQKAE